MASTPYDHCGDFIDPRGFAITLRAPSEEEYRVLVTKKLAAGWKQAGGLPVKPLVSEQVIGIGADVATIAAAAVDAPDPPVVAPSAEERVAAATEALSTSE